MAARRYGIEEAANLVGTEYGGKCAWLFGVDDVGNEVVSFEDVAVEEAECAGDLIEETPGCRLYNELELEVAKLVGRESIGRAVEVFGCPSDGGNVGGDGPG
jgi:hypothetical protein